MKGLTKAVMRTPHQLTSRIGMAKKTADIEYDDYNRKFTDIESATEKLLRDSASFRDAVQTLLISGSSFSTSLANLFSPLGSEYNLSAKHPNAEVTLGNIGSYQGLMEELRETLAPELELVESRVIVPVKEIQDICKKIRKTTVKRDHKLVDFDRHNNSLEKLRNKKEKSLSDEKNLFKVEQDFELASQEYDHYNDMLKAELPVFLEMAGRFAAPIFHSFYYMQLNIFYLMQEKLQSYADGKYDLTADVEETYQAQRADAFEQLEDLTITKRMVSTAKLMSVHRSNSGISSPTKASLARKESTYSTTGSTLGRSTSTSKYALPPVEAGVALGSASSIVSAPPPYSSGGTVKKAPPPPPAMKRNASVVVAKPPTCTALFDFVAQADGDLSFSAGDVIEIIERSDSQDDWWTGRINGGVSGVFPGSYTKVD